MACLQKQALSALQTEDVQERMNAYINLAHEICATTHPSPPPDAHPDPGEAEAKCVCGHPKSAHDMTVKPYGKCTVPDCACGPGCIHDGFVDASEPTAETRGDAEFATFQRWLNEKGYNPQRLPSLWEAYLAGAAKARAEVEGKVEVLRAQFKGILNHKVVMDALEEVFPYHKDMKKEKQ